MLKKIVSLFLILCTAITCVPVNASEEASPLLDLSCKSAILIEQSTGQVLYEQNADEQLPMASVTKIMTMLLIMEALDSCKITLDEMVVGSQRAKSMGGSTIYLDAGEALSVHDMLKGIAVASANDACVAMAEHIAGSEEAFVAMMNEKAQSLGMSNTCFKNTNGLDAEGHYSSARDIALMSAALLTYPKITEYTTIWMDSLRDGAFQLANTNKLIRFYKGANGLKTGSTSQALYCLSGAAKREDMQLIAVVMAAPTSPKRFSDASKLLDYGFANYGIINILNPKSSCGEIVVEKGLTNNVTAVTSGGFSRLQSKNVSGKFETKVNLPEKITAPIVQGERLGDVKIYEDDVEIGCVDIVAAHDVEKLTYWKMFSNVVMGLVCSVK